MNKVKGDEERKTCLFIIINNKKTRKIIGTFLLDFLFSAFIPLTTDHNGNSLFNFMLKDGSDWQQMYLCCRNNFGSNVSR